MTWTSTRISRPNDLTERRRPTPVQGAGRRDAEPVLQASRVVRPLIARPARAARAGRALDPGVRHRSGQSLRLTAKTPRLSHGAPAVSDDFARAGLKFARGDNRDAVATATPTAQAPAVAPRTRARDTRPEPKAAVTRATDRDVERVHVAAAARPRELQIQADALRGKGDLKGSPGTAARRRHRHLRGRDRRRQNRSEHGDQRHAAARPRPTHAASARWPSQTDAAGRARVKRTHSPERRTTRPAKRSAPPTRARTQAADAPTRRRH